MRQRLRLQTEPLHGPFELTLATQMADGVLMSFFSRSTTCGCGVTGTLLIHSALKFNPVASPLLQSIQRTGVNTSKVSDALSRNSTS